MTSLGMEEMNALSAKEQDEMVEPIHFGEKKKGVEIVTSGLPARAITGGREALLSTTVKHSVSLLGDQAQGSHALSLPGAAANEADSLSKSEDTQSANIKHSKYGAEEAQNDQGEQIHKYQQCSTSTQGLEVQENQPYQEQILQPYEPNQPTVQQKVVEQQILAEEGLRSSNRFATGGTPERGLPPAIQADFRQDQLQARQVSKSRQYVVNEYGEGVASHHFSMKGGTSKSVKRDQNTRTKNALHYIKGARVKKGAAPGTAQTHSRQYDGLATHFQRGSRVKLREQYLPGARTGHEASSAEIEPASTNQNLSRPDPTGTMAEFEPRYSATYLNIAANQDANTNESSLFYSDKAAAKGLALRNASGTEIKRPISMGMLRRPHKGQRGHAGQYGLRTTGSLRGSTSKDRAELAKSHNNLLYVMQKQGHKHNVHGQMQTKYSLQQQIEAQQQQIEQLKKMNEDLLQNNYRPGLSQLDHILDAEQQESQQTSKPNVHAVNINTLISRKGCRTQKGQVFNKTANLYDSDSHSHPIIQHGSFVHDQHYSSAVQSDHIKTMGNRTEMDMYPLKWPPQQEGHGNSPSRNMGSQQKFYHQRQTTEEEGARSVIPLDNEEARSQEYVINRKAQGDKHAVAPNEALEMYQNAPHGAQGARKEPTYATSKQTRSSLTRPTYEPPGAQAPRSSVQNYRNMSSSISEFAFRSQQDQTAYSSHQVHRGPTREHQAAVKTTSEKEEELHEMKNQMLYNDDADGHAKDYAFKSSQADASMRRDDSIEQERTQFISINHVNVINLQANSVGRKTNDYFIDNEPNQNIFDKMATANSGREQVQSSPNQPSRLQNHLSQKGMKFAQDSLITNKKPFETTTLPLKQNPSQKKVGQDLTLLRKEWRRFKAVLDGKEYERINKNERIPEKKDADSSTRQDGLQTLALLLNQPFVQKLPELKDILLALQTQVVAQFSKQQKDQEFRNSQLQSKYDRLLVDHGKLAKDSKELKSHLAREEGSLARFMKKANKEGILQEIADYEQMERLAPEGHAPLDSYEYQYSLKLQQEEHRQAHKYSDCRQNLKEMDYLLTLRGDLCKELTGNLVEIKKDQDYEHIVEGIEKDVVARFQDLQVSTARKVLQRCLKQVASKDAATQMGKDMFREERIAFQTRITALDEEVEELDHHVRGCHKEIETLKKEKILQSQEIRALKRELQELYVAHDAARATVTEQKHKLRQVEGRSFGNVSRIRELEAERADIRYKCETYLANISHLDGSLQQKRSKKKKYKQQVQELEEQIAKLTLQNKQKSFKVAEDPAFISMKNKLEAARDRLHRGEKRQLRRVRRGKDGQTYPATESDNSGDLTDESYYLPAPSQSLEKPIVQKKTTKDKGTATLGLAVEPKPKAEASEAAGLPIDILSDQDYFNVLASVGAIPSGIKLQNMQDDEIRRMITSWFDNIPNTKAGKKSIKVDLQKLAGSIATELIKRLKELKSNPVIVPITYDLPGSLKSHKKEKVTKFAEEDESEGHAKPKGDGQMRQQAQQTSGAVSTSRIDQETARLSPRNEQFTEPKKLQSPTHQMESSDHSKQIVGDDHHGRLQPTSNESVDEHYQAYDLPSQAYDSRAEDPRGGDRQKVFSQRNSGQLHATPPMIEHVRSENKTPEPMASTPQQKGFEVDRRVRHGLQQRGPQPNFQPDRRTRSKPAHAQPLPAIILRDKQTQTHGALCASEQTQTETAYQPFDQETRKQIANILGNKLGRSSDNYNTQLAHTFQSSGNQLQPEELYMNSTSQSTTRMFYPSCRPRLKTYEKVLLNCRQKEPPAKIDSIQRAVARLEAEQRTKAGALAAEARTKATRGGAARALTSGRPQTQLLVRREGTSGSLPSVGQLPQLHAPLGRNLSVKDQQHGRTNSRNPDTIRAEAPQNQQLSEEQQRLNPRTRTLAIDELDFNTT